MTELPNPFLISDGGVEGHAATPSRIADEDGMQTRDGRIVNGAGIEPGPSESRFTLDEPAFMDAIEPAPLFLSDPRPEYLDAIPDAVLAVLAGY